MRPGSDWDWNPGKREILDTAAAAAEYDWVEEYHASPDGEKLAAVAKVPNEDEAEFTVLVNGEAWESTFEKAWYPRFSPDGRMTVIAATMGEWTLAVDGEPLEENYGYLWGTQFSEDGSVIACNVQRDGEYGMLVNGAVWETMYENANNFILARDGSATAAVVQTRNIPQADIFTFQEGCFSVAKDGEAWERNFVNCWTPVFDAKAQRVATQVRTTLYDYTIAVDGAPWASLYQMVWEPRFNPATGRVIAPVRQKGKWGLAQDNTLIWDPVLFQCWHPQFSADGAHLYAIVSPAFGRWTIAVDGKNWGTTVSILITDLTLSPDGKRAAAVCKDDPEKWSILADDRLWPGKYEMAWQPVFSADSKHVAAKVEKPGKKYTLLCDGKAYGKDFDQMWDPVFSPKGDAVLLRVMEGSVYSRIVLPLSEL